jgi:hypothetical protein
MENVFVDRFHATPIKAVSGYAAGDGIWHAVLAMQSALGPYIVDIPYTRLHVDELQPLHKSSTDIKSLSTYVTPDSFRHVVFQEINGDISHFRFNPSCSSNCDSIDPFLVGHQPPDALMTAFYSRVFNDSAGVWVENEHVVTLRNTPKTPTSETGVTWQEYLYTSKFGPLAVARPPFVDDKTITPTMAISGTQTDGLTKEFHGTQHPLTIEIGQQTPQNPESQFNYIEELLYEDDDLSQGVGVDSYEDKAQYSGLLLHLAAIWEPGTGIYDVVSTTDGSVWLALRPQLTVGDGPVYAASKLGTF